MKKKYGIITFVVFPIPLCRGVAQFGRALRSGRRGRRFKSCHLDHSNIKQNPQDCYSLGGFAVIEYID